MKFIKLFISNLTKSIKSGIINSIPYIGIALLVITIVVAVLSIFIGFIAGVSYLLDYIGLPELSPLSVVTILGILLGIMRVVLDEDNDSLPTIKEFIMSIVYTLIAVYVSTAICYLVFKTFTIQEGFIIPVVAIIFISTTFILGALWYILKKTYKEYKEEK